MDTFEGGRSAAKVIQYFCAFGTAVQLRVGVVDTSVAPLAGEIVDEAGRINGSTTTGPIAGPVAKFTSVSKTWRRYQ